jgi:nicotinamidase-related amidase
MTSLATKKDPPRTLLDFAGVSSEPSRLSESVLVIIDAQKEYFEGKVKLEGLDEALAEAARLLERARKLGSPVVHVTHENRSGAALFAAGTRAAEIIDALRPTGSEIVIRKTMANSFFDSSLEDEIGRTGRKSLVIIGYMTHMAVDATVRAALERGLRSTVVGDACATRDLADGYGGVIAAADVHNATLAALRDRFAAVVRSASEVPD